MVGCSTTFDLCQPSQCAPEPGTYIGGGEAVGPEMGITVSGGLAPYTVRFKNFTVVSQSGNYSSSGDCVYFGGSAGFSVPNTGNVYSLTINSSGGLVSGLYMTASCGNAIYQVNGEFTVEVTDAAGQVISTTYPYVIKRSDKMADMNLNFERGDVNWTKGTGWSIIAVNDSSFGASSTRSAKFQNSSNVEYDMINNTRLAVNPGQAMWASMQEHSDGWQTNDYGTKVMLVWYTSAGSRISETLGSYLSGDTDNQLRTSSAVGSAPSNAAFVTVGVRSRANKTSSYGSYDNFTISYTAPGGGGGGGGDPSPGGCVTCDSIIYNSGIASSVMVGDMMSVIDPVTFEMSNGLVSMANIGPQPCVRITTASGVTLECSTTAPIALADGTQALAPTLLGLDVSVYDNGMVITDKVVTVEDIGVKDTVYITCENNYFLAGSEEGRYLLHHNLIKVTP